MIPEERNQAADATHHGVSPGTMEQRVGSVLEYAFPLPRNILEYRGQRSIDAGDPSYHEPHLPFPFTATPFTATPFTAGTSQPPLVRSR